MCGACCMASAISHPGCKRRNNHAALRSAGLFACAWRRCLLPLVCRQSRAAATNYECQIAINRPMLFNYRAPIRAYADRLVCNPGYNGATIHFDAVNPSDSWIVELVVHIAGFHHNGPPIRHNPTTHSVKGKTGKAESSIAARLDQLIAGPENKAARPIFTDITPSFGVNKMWMQIAGQLCAEPFTCCCIGMVHAPHGCANAAKISANTGFPSCIKRSLLLSGFRPKCHTRADGPAPDSIKIFAPMRISLEARNGCPNLSRCGVGMRLARCCCLALSDARCAHDGQTQRQQARAR